MNVRVLALAMWCMCTSWLPCYAQDLPPDLEDFRIAYWRGGDGIAVGQVRSIVEDQNGYLWLAASVGLVRFDGLRFAATELTSGTRELPVAPCRALYLAKDGSMWVGYANGQGVYHIVHGEVHQVYLQNQITGFINAIIEDSDGTVWVGHDQGLHRFQGGVWESIPVSSGNDQRVFDIHEDRAHRLWVATATGLYRGTGASRFDPVSPSEGIVRAISEDANGQVWVTDERGGFRRAGTNERNRLFDGSGTSLLHDREGNLWVTANGQGLWQVRGLSNDRSTPTLRRATARTGMLSDEGSSFLEDRAGNIWVGANQGLNRLTPLKVSRIVDIGVVVSVAIGGDETVWTGTASRLIAIAPSTADEPEKVRVIGSVPVRTLHAARDGTIWVATAEGLQSVVNDRLQPVLISGGPLTHITSIASDRRGGVWVTDEQEGLLHLSPGRTKRIAAATAGLSARPLFAHIDRAGRAWIAFEGGLIRAIDTDGLVHQYGTPEGLPHTTVYATYDDEVGNVWVGGSGGLSLFREGRFHTLAKGQGPPEALAVTTDNIGNLWITDAFRILRFRRDDVVRAMSDPSYRLQYGEYAEREGVAGQPRLGVGNVARAPTGTLWFVTARGLTVVDPTRLRNELSAPPERPRIEGAVADDRRMGAEAGALLPPRIGRLRIDYALLSLSSLDPRTRFRYRLDGFDADWVDGTRTRQAFYTNLLPGPYRFRLQTTNQPDWDLDETTWSFSIQPMFYQTAWFLSLSTIALALIAAYAWRLRLHQVRRAFSAVFDERMRLSREIHDTLLQSFVGISLQLDSASRDLKDSSSGVREQLVRARQQIEECVTEARNSIWDLRSPALDREGLIGTLRATAEQLTAGKLRFSLMVTGTPRQCPSNLEMQLIRIGHEAVSNAVWHSHAKRVRMEVGFDDRFVRLRISDDGRGFDPECQKTSGTATHYGLAMMKERATQAGGRCTIKSSPGSGVQVLAEFPLPSQA